MKKKRLLTQQLLTQCLTSANACVRESEQDNPQQTLTGKGKDIEGRGGGRGRTHLQSLPLRST